VCESASNDECSGAIPIVVALTGEEPEEVTMTTRTGTSSTVPCDVQASDVWYSFVAPTAGITITSTNSESAAIYSGTCGSLTCHDDDALNTPWNVTGLTPGTSYFLKLGENNTLRESTIRVMAQPSNDECSDAVGLDVLPYQSGEGFVHGHTGGAATGAPACLNTQPRDVWYSFTATAANTSSIWSRPFRPSSLDLPSARPDRADPSPASSARRNGALPLKVSGLTPGTNLLRPCVFQQQQHNRLPHRHHRGHGER
jgi:hypothetical protein